MPMRRPDPTRWMWEEACEMLERAERMQRQFFQVRDDLRRGPTWEPPVDIVETDRELTILIALPGVRASDMDVLIDGGMLIVRGARALPTFSDRGVIHRLEIPHGRFERRILLQAATLELVRREVIDGCLLLSLNKLV